MYTYAYIEKKQKKTSKLWNRKITAVKAYRNGAKLNPSSYL